MNNTVAKFYEKVASVVLLAIAISFSFRLFATENLLIDSHKKSIEHDNGAILVTSADDTDVVTTYDEIIGMLLNGLTYDIKIEDIYINASSFSPYTFDYKKIMNCNYKKTYQYELDGTVSYVQFMPIL